MSSQAVCDGWALHSTVPASKWCVTRQDLLTFRRDIEHAIIHGQIVPTSKDFFDPEDRCYGPSIYTINEQFIKPVTARTAGNASWALMLHPDGLECDLFITHAWQEGVFELIDKVIASWPQGARHAYCCVLSNPQNLDICSLISSPRTSPFARALWAARYMLVVPNRQVSIYTRIWCSYEAFLAYTWQKHIFTAHAPVTGLFRFYMAVPLLVLIALCVGGIVSVCAPYTAPYANDIGATQIHFMIYVSVSWLLVACISIDSPCVVRPMNYIGIALVALALMFYVNIFSHDAIGHRKWMKLAFQLGFSASDTASFLASEFDMMCRQVQEVEAQQLLRDFSGRTIDAKCTVQADGDMINAEVEASGNREAVDEAVKVLIQAGMSTPDLQATAAHGVRLKGAAHSKYSLLIASWTRWLLYGLAIGCANVRFSLGKLPPWQLCVSIAIVSSALFFAVKFMRWHSDRRHFAIDAVATFLWTGFIIPWQIWLSIEPILILIPQGRDGPCLWCQQLRQATTNYPDLIKILIFSLMSVLTVIVSCLGPGELVRVPWVGKGLVRIVFARNLYQYYYYYRRQGDVPSHVAARSCQSIELAPISTAGIMV